MASSMFPEPPSQTRFGGMTVNERLFEAGTTAQFDEAVGRRDRAALVQLLMAVELTQEEAEETTRAIFANPAKYGYR